MARTTEDAVEQRLRRHDGAATDAFAAQRLSIVVDHLTERFRVPLDRPPTLKERLAQLRRSQYRTFDALRDVSFQVRHGESVGIIGHNGSGKSTLLKCLARIYEPDTGTVTVNGRIATLLELGAGFHPDLSGRENVYLNGAILGLRRTEIDAGFDSIVDFAGVADFIDAPVRNYSSGMYVRLGFAIAVHVDPEVLLVDEVLAVGDAEFQERSLARMRGFNQRGKTVVLVSHDLGSVAALCERTLVLHHGRLVFDGPTDEGVEYYDELIHGRRPAPAVEEAPAEAPPAPAEAELAVAEDATPQRIGDRGAVVTDLRLLVDGVALALPDRTNPGDPDPDPDPDHDHDHDHDHDDGSAHPPTVVSGAVAQLLVSFTATEAVQDAGSLSVGVNVRRTDLQLTVYETRTSWRGTYLAPPRPGATATLTFTFDAVLLTGPHAVDLLIANATSGAIHDRWSGAVEFDVESPAHEFGVARLDARIGVHNPDAAWPPHLHAPPPERGGPRSHPLIEDRPSPGYEPGLARLDAEGRLQP